MSIFTPTYTTVTLDDYFIEGFHENTQPMNPINALGIGIPFGTVLELSSIFKNLSILARNSVGLGSSILNEGEADQGTLLGGSWITGTDQRVYLNDPRIQFPHHTSMEGTIPSGTEDVINISVGAWVRNWTAGTLLFKKNVFDVNRTLVQNLPEDEWFSVAILVSGTSRRVFINGLEQWSETETNPITHATNDFFIGQNDVAGDPATAEIGEVAFLADANILGLLQSLSAFSGTWRSPIIDLGSEKTLSKITHPDSYIAPSHNLTLELRLSDTNPMQTFKNESFVLGDQHEDFPNRSFYPREYLKGRYLQAITTLSKDRILPFLPFAKGIEFRLR